MELIPRSDPAYFTMSSNDLYDRHQYKIVSKTGDETIVSSWEEANLIWFEKKDFLSHIEVLNEQKGFK